jgi:hypothetical protein
LSSLLALSIAEILACAIIGLAVFMVAAGIVFNLSLSAIEAFSNWKVERASRRGRR